MTAKIAQERYDELHKELGELYRCSPRVIQYIRSKFSQVYNNDVEKYEVAIVEFRKHLEHDLVEVNKSWRAVKLDYIYLLSKPEQGLKKDNHRIDLLKDQLPHVLGFIDKVAFRKSCIGFLKRVSVDEFKAIIEEQVKL